MLAVIGRESLSEGAQIVACHIDSPHRLDLKPHPIYEDSELAYGKTHYYGGIRKYQWVAIPAAAGCGSPEGRHGGVRGAGRGRRAQVRHQ